MGAVDLLRMRVAALRAGEERAPSVHREMSGLLGRLAGGGGDAMTPPASASLRSPEATSDESGAELGMRDDTRVRQETSRVTRSVHHCAFRPPGRVRPRRRRAQSSQAVSYLDRALLPQAGPKFPVTAE